MFFKYRKIFGCGVDNGRWESNDCNKPFESTSYLALDKTEYDRRSECFFEHI